MKTFIEKGYGWPLFVIVLLVSSVGMMGLVVMAAKSDGGAQVVDNYYRDAVQWDSLANARNAASQLGWTAILEVSSGNQGITGVITLADSSNTALTGQQAIVRLTRPQLADVVAESPAQESEVSGAYSFSSTAAGSGLWDIQVMFTDPSNTQQRVQFNWRRELR